MGSWVIWTSSWKKELSWRGKYWCMRRKISRQCWNVLYVFISFESTGLRIRIVHARDAYPAKTCQTNFHTILLANYILQEYKCLRNIWCLSSDFLHFLYSVEPQFTRLYSQREFVKLYDWQVTHEKFWYGRSVRVASCHLNIWTKHGWKRVLMHVHFDIETSIRKPVNLCFDALHKSTALTKAWNDQNRVVCLRRYVLVRHFRIVKLSASFDLISQNNPIMAIFPRR